MLKACGALTTRRNASHHSDKSLLIPDLRTGGGINSNTHKHLSVLIFSKNRYRESKLLCIDLP